ncbi:MAG: hypothetical protein ACYDBQ_05775 [Thermoplasmatota archaeon]
MQLFGLPLPGYDLNTTAGVVAFAVEIVVMAAFVHLAASVVGKKSSPAQAFMAGTLGLVGAQLALDVVSPAYWILGLALGLALFGGCAALVYRGKFREGAAIGAVAWVLWILANIALGYLQSHWHP